MQCYYHTQNQLKLCVLKLIVFHLEVILYFMYYHAKDSRHNNITYEYVHAQ